MNNTTTETPPQQNWIQQFGKWESIARKTLACAIVAGALISICQYVGASSVASFMQRENMDAWAAKTPENAHALAKYQHCEQSNVTFYKIDCINSAASGQRAIELEAVSKMPSKVFDSLPAPLRWFL